nr:DUF987 family protein [Klebsiella variicola]
MKIISKRQAMAIYRQHSESRLFRFCTGKYKWSGSICHYYGREVQDTGPENGGFPPAHA